METLHESRFCKRIQGDIQGWLEETILNKKRWVLYNPPFTK